MCSISLVLLTVTSDKVSSLEFYCFIWNSRYSSSLKIERFSVLSLLRKGYKYEIEVKLLRKVELSNCSFFVSCSF